MANSIDEFRKYMYNGFDPEVNKADIPTVQLFLDTQRDGVWGPKSQAALDAFRKTYEAEQAEPAATPEKVETTRKEVKSPYLNSLLSTMDDDRYSWNRVSSPFQYADETASAMVGADGLSGKERRISEIKQRLAEIAKEKKQYSLEEGMARYKFLYDADPSAYMNLKQNLRNAEATKQIHEANDKKSERESLRNSWKESGTSLLVARYDLADAENAYKQAVSAGDPDAVSKAGLALSRAKANYQAKLRENEALRSKVYENFGIKVQDTPKEEELYRPEDDANYRSAALLQRTKNDLNALQKEVKTDNVAIHPTEKKNNIAGWTSRLDALEKQMKDSTLSDKNRGDLELQVQEIREAIRNYGKPAGKGGQLPKVTQAEVDAMNFTDLKRKGYAWLKAIRDAGLTHPDLNKAINATRNKK